MLINKGIKRILVIESSGLNLFSRDFEKCDLDDVLFAGFSAAIVAFAKEMGKELHDLTLNDESFYFKTKNNFIFILSTSSEFDKRRAFSILNNIIDTVKWKQLESYLNRGVFFTTEEFNETVEEVLKKYL